MSEIAFFVPGLPAPKGSARGFVVGGRAVVTHDSKRTKPWERDIKTFASQAWKGPPTIGAVSLKLAFTLPRPKSLAKRFDAHTKRPDLDKMIRAALDALTHIIYADDSQVTEIHAVKRYGPQVGLAVAVSIV